MPSENLGEIIEWVFPQVVVTCRSIISSVLREKNAPVQVVDNAGTSGEVVTTMDVNASQIILEGSRQFGIDGLRSRYPGSFSEEEDTEKRLSESVIYENDPLDGTGDLVKTKDAGCIVSPTNLTTKLIRDPQSGLFIPVAGMIYHILGEYALVSDGQEIVFGRADKRGSFVNCPVLIVEPGDSGTLYLSYRQAFPDANPHPDFIKFLREEGEVEQVPSGGAGLQALQLLRSLIQPQEYVEGFSDLQPVDTIFNCQADWKTWDTDWLLSLVKALGLPKPTDIYGRPLEANAAKVSRQKMYHRNGCVFAVSKWNRDFLTTKAADFEEKTGCKLTITRC